MTLFVDTGCFFAAADRGDKHNARAKAILSAGEARLTSDHVLVETWLLLRSRLGRQAADRFWKTVRDGAARVEHVGEADMQVALTIGEEFADQDFSIVDQTSFAVIRRLGIQRVAAFDHHFAVYRFGPGRRLALEIVR